MIFRLNRGGEIILKCLMTEGYLFNKKEVREGYKRLTNYQGIITKKQYNVYGIILVQESVKYLLFNDFEMANWYPVELFQVVDSQLPRNWCFQFFGYEEYGVSAIWGYREIVENEEHYTGLCEQEKNDIELFLKRKKEIDNCIN